MGGLWRFNRRGPTDGSREGKYLVRAVGPTNGPESVLKHPGMVWGARDPAAPDGLRAYMADARERSVVGQIDRSFWRVNRRDGTVPDWPFAVLSAIDPCAPAALEAYAVAAAACGMDPEYSADVKALAGHFRRYRLAFGEPTRATPAEMDRWIRQHALLIASFENYLAAYGKGDPDAPKHRKDDPAIMALMAYGQSA